MERARASGGGRDHEGPEYYRCVSGRVASGALGEELKRHAAEDAASKAAAPSG